MKDYCPTCEGDVCGVESPRSPSIADAYRSMLEDLISPDQYGHAIPPEIRAKIFRLLEEHRIRPTPGYP